MHSRDNPIFDRLCKPTEFEVEGWKKIITVVKCLNLFVPGAWENLELQARRIQCDYLKGKGILPKIIFYYSNKLAGKIF